MADIDNLKGGTKRGIGENTIDNLRGGTKRVYEENTINNLRGGTKRVILVGGGGGNIDELNVTPSTSAQTITASGGVDGYSPVNVSAVDATIDANITAGNIKKDVSILGITGTYEGQTPTGSISITSNGTYDVTDKAEAVVNVPTTAPAHYIQRNVDANGKLVKTGAMNVIDLTGVTSIGEVILYQAYKGNTSLTGTIDMGDVSTITESRCCTQMFDGCTGITALDWSSLQTMTTNAGAGDYFDGACFRMFANSGIVTADLSNLTTVNASNGMYDMFYGCSELVSVDLRNLTALSGGYSSSGMFYNCVKLQEVHLENLTDVFGCTAMFYGCVALKQIYLPKITSRTYNVRPTTRDFFAFGGSGLEVCDVRNLQSAGDYGLLDNMLAQTQYLKKINVNSLEHIGNDGARAFLSSSNNPSSTLTDVYFPMLTSFGSNPFYTNCFGGRLGLTIHFRKDIQATVEALANYSTMWGAGTGSSVVFDLVGTLTGADSNAYTRSEIDSVYASETAGAAKTATGWKYNNTVYYTSGGSEPSVGDTIYSDSACTTVVTIISSIA